MKIIRGIWRNPLGAAGLFIIGLSGLLSLFAYLFITDKTPHANEMHLALSNLPPGSEVDFLRLPREVDKVSAWNAFWNGRPAGFERIALKDYSIEDSKFYYQEYGSPADAEKKQLDLAAFFSASEIEQYYFLGQRTFYLGTDRFGRDLMSRLVLGARISFSVGFLAVLISLLIGIPLGAIAAYYGGWIDKVILWLINVVWSIPGLLMVIAITLALGKGLWQVFIAIGFTMWVEVARVIRGQIMSIREKEYVQAAKVLAFSDARIIFKHILPNALAPLIVISAANFAAAILVESGLSFLGLGAQPPTPTWGTMIKDHYAYLIMDKAYLAIIPGMAIMLLVLSFMFVGNALRDTLDVKAT